MAGFNKDLVYCDLIAYTIHSKLGEITDGFLTGLKVSYDLAEEGYLQSTTKYISVVDRNGRKYKITVEEDDS
jgi:hypothetical protein